MRDLTTRARPVSTLAHAGPSPCPARVWRGPTEPIRPRPKIVGRYPCPGMGFDPQSFELHPARGVWGLRDMWGTDAAERDHGGRDKGLGLEVALVPGA